MRISDWSSDVCSSDLPSGRGCANSGVRATIAVFVQPTETMYRILTLAAASLAALLAFSACTSQAVLNDLTTDKGYTLTADVPYDREHHLTLDVYSPHNVRSEEHTSALQSLLRISYAVFRLKKKNITPNQTPPPLSTL